MNQFSSFQIRGTWGDVLLPRNADDTIDHVRLKAEVSTLVDSDLAEIHTNGTVRELHTQSESEFDKISSLVAEHAKNSGMPFQLGASHPQAQTCLESIKRVPPTRNGIRKVADA